MIAGAVVAGLFAVGIAFRYRANSSSSGDQAPGSQSPLGVLFGDAGEVSRRKDLIESLIPVRSAFAQFAKAHDDELPKSLVELRPYLPKDLAGLDDEHWQIPATGKLTPQMDRDIILLQQKNVPADHPKIGVYMDGRIEWKK